MNITANTFFGKLQAEKLANDCVESDIEAGGSNPTDVDGKCLLPTTPLQGDIDYFESEMTKWKEGEVPTDEEEDIFLDSYESKMSEYIAHNYE